MQKFKQVSQTYIYNKLLKFFGNMVKNYNLDVEDDDFFDVLRNNFEHDKAVELIRVGYSTDEIKYLSEHRTRYGRLDLTNPLDDIFQILWNNTKKRDLCRSVLQAIVTYMTRKPAKGETEAIEQRFKDLQRALKLSDLELDVLMMAYIQTRTCFCWPIRVDNRDKPLYFAMALDCSYAEVLKAMSAKGKLRKFNLLDEDWDFNRCVVGPFLDGTENEPIERRFYKKNEEAEKLPWKFFGELAEKDGELLKRVLATNPKRCNILLYGEPGTGKTSFARSLAREANRIPWEIKQGDDDGKNMEVGARMVGIRVCNSQETADESLIIVDEADELLRSGYYFGGFFGRSQGSTEKGIMNTLLDEMEVPTIWISNTPAEAMDESVRRRFDYSICFNELNNMQRVSIWRNVVKKFALGNIISEEKMATYAMKYATSAGGISTVLENVKRLNPTQDQIDELVEMFMKPHCQLMDVKAENRFLPAKGYSLEGLNIKGKVKLDKIVKAIRNYMNADFNAKSEDKPRMNLLMFGPPGTGKTEFVKYLGKELDRKVLVMKGSDILGMYVGESEKNIAKAFCRAEKEHAILFFDEIDGLVQNRENAHASWEVSQVNELLQQMENFNGVMIAATNFCQNLDPAIMRRFTFKLEFDYLDDAGKRLFFEKMFKVNLSEAEFASLKTLQNLTPGDFRTVRQETFYLDDETKNEDLIAALREECVLKRDGGKTSKIGFAA